MKVLKVLIVDDDPDGLGVLVEQVRRLGHQVTACFRASVAKMLILDDEKFDVIIMDNDMPEVSGAELLRWFVREWEPFGGTKLILMSGNQSKEIDELIREAPDIVFLQKPVPPDLLIQHLGS